MDNAINMKYCIIKKVPLWARIWTVGLAGVALSGCSTNASTNANADNLPVRVEIHDRRGLLQDGPTTGETLTAVPVCPSGKCTSELHYQWYIAKSQGAEAIPGATSVTYTPSATDMNSRLFVRVRAE
jgi:hypothetical protein